MQIPGANIMVLGAQYLDCFGNSLLYTVRPTILVLYKIRAPRIMNEEQIFLNTGEHFWAGVETSLHCLHFTLIT